MNDGRPRDSLVEFPTLSSPSLARGSYHEMMQRQLCYAVCYSYCADWLKIGCLFGALVAGLPQTLNAQTLNAQSAPSESNRRLVIVQRVNNASTTGKSHTGCEHSRSHRGLRCACPANRASAGSLAERHPNCASARGRAKHPAYGLAELLGPDAFGHATCGRANEQSGSNRSGH